MRKRLPLFLLFFGIAACLAAEKLAELPEIGRPEDLYINGNRFYLTIDRQPTVFAYNLETFKFIKQFLKRGAGPAEIQDMSISLKILPHRLSVSGNSGKVLFFSRDGEYIEERRVPSDIEKVIPLGKNFLGEIRHIDNKEDSQYWTINLFDGEFNTLKVLSEGYHYNLFSSKKKKKKDFPIVHDLLDYVVYENRVYLANSHKGFSIAVFDTSGKLLFEINKEYKKIKVPSSLVDDWLASRFRNQPERVAMLKSIFNIVAPDYYPAFAHVWVNSGKIYALTNEYKKAAGAVERELVVLDLAGRELKRIFVPYLRYSFAVWQDKYYYLHENPDKEVWELHAQQIM